MEPMELGHPRIHLTADTLRELKARAADTHALYYRELLATADEYVAAGKRRFKSTGDDNRYHGDLMPVIAMAFLLSGDEKYLDSARHVLSRLVGFEHWGDDLDLVTGHYMAGAAITYDWLGEYLSGRERAKARERIAHHAEILNRYAREQRIWWHDYFLHNWAHVITGSLAYAAAALWGEDERTSEWIEHADGFFTKVAEALPEDGSYQEGMAYMTYAWECILRYFDLAKGLFGRDHFGCEWMKAVPYNVLHFTTPRPVKGDNCMVFGDGPRSFEWHGPVHLLNRCAAEYDDAVIQGYARWLVERGVGLTRTGSWLNMLWYDDKGKSEDFRSLPTFKHLANLDTVSMRSGWGEDAVMLGFKCTDNAGKKTVAGYPGRDLGSGHAHPDAASFQLYAFGEWLAVDPGYTHFKQSANHNTMLVNNTQQLGGERMWYDMMECFGADGPCEITDVVSTDEYDYARGDASGIYRPQARLKRFIRHVVFLKPADILIVDELEGEVKSKFEWRLHADEEILGEGREFTIVKNDARARVLFLAPEGLKTSVGRHKIQGTGRHGQSHTFLLKATPTGKTRRTLFATLITPYRGERPSSDALLESVGEGAVSITLARDRLTRRVVLNPGAALIDISARQ